jgi:hypothetical protein
MSDLRVRRLSHCSNDFQVITGHIISGHMVTADFCGWHVHLGAIYWFTNCGAGFVAGKLRTWTGKERAEIMGITSVTIDCTATATNGMMSRHFVARWRCRYAMEAVGWVLRDTIYDGKLRETSQVYGTTVGKMAISSSLCTLERRFLWLNC